jgi:asparagine synthase (glutamine-hydrolysing)
MCGITGYISHGETQAARALLEAMTEAIEHRGPDGAGFYVAGPAALGMRRLAIIDLHSGDQPFFSRDGLQALIFNGEIYNYRTLRAELAALGQRFDSSADTEVIMRGVEQWGLEACLARLNGMFAFALWHAGRGELTLVRDRLGIKPLYFYAGADAFVFGSEIKALLRHPAVPRAIDPRAQVNYLTFGHSVGGSTMLQGVRKLPPAHVLRLSLGDPQPRVQRYWDVPLQPALNLTAEEAAHECYARLREAVRLQLISDVPLGAFLSGGLDSSIIVGLMAELGSSAPRTFSVGFAGQSAYSELADARLVARHFGTEHHELEIRPSDLPAMLELLVYHYDEPFGDAAALPLALLARFARRHVTVALTGEGSDEQWAGYRRYRAELLANAYRRLPGHAALGALVRRLPRLRRLKQAVTALEVADPARRYAAWLTVTHAERRAALLDPALLEAAGDYDPTDLYQQIYPQNGLPPLTKMGYTDLVTWLPDTYLEKVDKATMAASLEARVPFLDHTLVEWAMRLPPQLKLAHGTTKWLLRKAFGQLLPASTIAKRKRGLGVPTDPWFRGELKGWTAEILLDERTERRGLLRPAEVRRLFQAHQSGQEVADGLLWLLLNLELWQRVYLDGVPSR